MHNIVNNFKRQMNLPDDQTVIFFNKKTKTGQLMDFAVHVDHSLNLE